jgi:hypothetical protein
MYIYMHVYTRLCIHVYIDIFTDTDLFLQACCLADWCQAWLGPVPFAHGGFVLLQEGSDRSALTCALVICSRACACVQMCKCMHICMHVCVCAYNIDTSVLDTLHVHENLYIYKHTYATPTPGDSHNMAPFPPRIPNVSRAQTHVPTHRRD